MSRTFRRKKHIYFYVKEWLLFYEWLATIYSNVDVAERVERSFISYSRDNHPGKFNAPKSYRKDLKRTFKAKNKQVLRRVVEGVDEEFIPFKKDANYHYF